MTTANANRAGTEASRAGAKLGKPSPTKARLTREVREERIAPMKRMKYMRMPKMERELTTLPPRKDDPGSGRKSARKSEKARSSGR